MNAFTKIVTGALVAGSLLLGPSCKNKPKEEDPRYIKRVAALEQMVNLYEQAKPELNDVESKEAMINCLTDVKNMLELFVPNYLASEKEYTQFVEVADSYSRASATDAANTKNPDLGAMRRARVFMDSTSEYIAQFECHKKPIDQIENIRKIILPNEKSGSMQNLCLDSSSKCCGLFESVEGISRDDISYLNKIIDYAEKNKDKESELISRLAKVFKSKKESVKSKADYYKNTFKQHNEQLKKYYPPESGKSQSF